MAKPERLGRRIADASIDLDCNSVAIVIDSNPHGDLYITTSPNDGEGFILICKNSVVRFVAELTEYVDAMMAKEMKQAVKAADEPS